MKCSDGIRIQELQKNLYYQNYSSGRITVTYRIINNFTIILIIIYSTI